MRIWFGMDAPKANVISLSMCSMRMLKLLPGLTSKHRLALELGWEEMSSRRAVHKVILYYKIVNNLCPNYLKNLLSVQVSERKSYSLRNLKNFTLFASRTERFNRSFLPSTTRLWNNISIDVRSTLSLGVFKKSLLSYFSFPAKKCSL